MSTTASCSLDCVKQLLTNIAASGLWSGVGQAGASAVGLGAGAAGVAVALPVAIPLSVGAIAMLAYIGLSLRSQRRHSLDQRKLHGALELVRRRNADTKQDAALLREALTDLGLELGEDHEQVMTQLRSIRARLAELDALAPLAGKPLDELRSFFQHHQGLLVSMGRFMEDNFTFLEEFGVRVEASLDELKASFLVLLADIRTIKDTTQRTETKVDALGEKLARTLERLDRSTDQMRAEITEEVRREFSAKLAQERSAREAAERLAQDVMDVKDVPGIEAELREKGGQAIVDELLKRVSGPQQAVLEAHRRIAAWAYLVGDIAQAEASLRLILGALPSDLPATNSMGHIAQLRGDLAEAERLYSRLLELAPQDESLQAVALGNLGMVSFTRGDLDKAEEMHTKALAIEEKLGRLEGIASEYANLGSVSYTRGDLDKAEEMYRKSLAIDEKLGCLEGMANQYSNLGSVYRELGDLKSAREHWTTARDLYQRLGARHKVAKVQGWLDALQPG
ncbi:MAG: tetratricopeptide repeat protein [Planctomycetota bacterium]|nr:tetratricopeptide repeat protein [Planctomycetota bacterium]